MKLSIELQTLKDCLEIIDNFAEGESPDSIKELKDLVKQASAKFRVVRRDETSFWSGDIHGTIYGVYLVDTNEVTHCCEIQPSYYLHHLYNTVVSENEAWAREIETSTTGDDENIYLHCTTVDNMLRSDFHPVSDVDENDLCDSYEELVESFVEHYRGNHYL